MKRLLVILFTLGIYSFMMGQERVNNSVISYKSSSETIKSVPGWYYDSSCEEWVEYENTLVMKEHTAHRPPKWYVQSMGIQNFNEMCFKTIDFGSKHYYILRFEYTKGYYRYPNIQVDWTASQPTVLCLYTEADYKKLLSLPTVANGTTITLNTLFEAEGIVINDDMEKELLVKVQNYLKRGSSGATYRPFKVYKSKEGAIRFYLPYGKKNADFNKYYYETTVEEFSKLFIQ